jgi:HEPN domain-containing protein
MIRQECEDSPVTRADWQHIAEERLLAAQALRAAQKWPSAYYLAGYAVECGLKSCILARVSTAPEVIFVEKRFSEKCWTHEIEELVKLAGLEGARDAETNANPALWTNWEIAKSWTERSRYQMKTQAEADDLYQAIADNVNGVMQWIRARW